VRTATAVTPLPAVLSERKVPAEGTAQMQSVSTRRHTVLRGSFNGWRELSGCTFSHRIHNLPHGPNQECFTDFLQYFDPWRRLPVAGAAPTLAGRWATAYHDTVRDVLNLVGAVTTLSYFLSCSLIFVLRLVGRAGPRGARRSARWHSPCRSSCSCRSTAAREGDDLLRPGRPSLLFITFEAVVDAILRVDFRSTRWTLVAYVVFFFAATGGMLGVASLAGPAWLIACAGGLPLDGGTGLCQWAATSTPGCSAQRAL